MGMDFLRQLFGPGEFMPHGYRYLWNPGLVWLHVISDTLIAASYFTIPFTLLWLMRKRRDLPFGWMFGLFGTFIVACGATHVMEVWNLWHAEYWLAGVLKAVTAVTSVATAILLARLVPQALEYPSVGQWMEANSALEREVRERRDLEINLRISENRYREQAELLDLTFDEVIVRNIKHEITYWNRGAEELYGWGLEEVLGKVTHDLFQTAFPKALEEIQADILMVEDVTERIALEKQLRQAQKFEAIGQLAGGIAHDFNNMIGAVLGWAEIGLDETEPQARLHRHFDKIPHRAIRAAALTRQLLAYARRQILEPRNLDLNQNVAETLSLLEKVIGSNIEINTKLAPELILVRADPTQVDQVLMNLCINARDAMPEGGLLIIETSDATFDEKYCAAQTFARPGHDAMLAVTDTGTGMDAATLDRIFEPFFTTKELDKGTGPGAGYRVWNREAAWRISACLQRGRNRHDVPDLSAGYARHGKSRCNRRGVASRARRFGNDSDRRRSRRAARAGPGNSGEPGLRNIDRLPRRRSCSPVPG
jgi:PAS domain S-box-containing protein